MAFDFQAYQALALQVHLFWYHFRAEDGTKTPVIGWKYWLPNPLFPFIAFRIAVPMKHPEFLVEID